MPIALEFYKNGVVIRHTGIITDEELIQAEREIYSHLRLEQLQFQIVDLTEVRDFKASADTMRHLGQTDYTKAHSLNRQHVAVIAPSQGRAMSSIWEAWAKDKDIDDPAILTKIVNTTEEAKKWLEENGINVSSNKLDAGDGK